MNDEFDERVDYFEGGSSTPPGAELFHAPTTPDLVGGSSTAFQKNEEVSRPSSFTDIERTTFQRVINLPLGLRFADSEQKQAKITEAISLLQKGFHSEDVADRNVASRTTSTFFESSIDELSSQAQELAVANIDQLSLALDPSNGTYDVYAIRLIAQCYQKKGLPEDVQQKLTKLLSHNLGSVILGAAELEELDRNKRDPRTPLLDTLGGFAYLQELKTELYQDEVRKLLKSEHIPEEKKEVLLYYADAKNEKFHQIILPVIEARLGKYGLNGEIYYRNFMESWGYQYKGQEGLPAGRNIIETVKTIDQLEAEHPGYTKSLLDNFGITNLLRYPLPLLVRQVESLNDTTTPYIFALYAKADYNGAFNQNGPQLESIQNQVGEAALLRILEVSDIRDAVAKARDMYERYGKAAGFIIAGHGAADSIGFGYSDYWKKLLLSDITKNGETRKGIQTFRSLLKDGANGVLISCSTGTEDGIAQELSEALQCRIVAPPESANLNKITATVTDGTVQFAGDYILADPITREMLKEKNLEEIDTARIVPASVYDKGVKVASDHS